MEGSENNPVMFELLTELPWASAAFRQGSVVEGVYGCPLRKEQPRCAGRLDTVEQFHL